MSPERRSKISIGIATGAAALALVALLVRVDNLDLVGIGTLALALATFVLALYTRSLVREAALELDVANRQIAVSQEQAAVAQKTLDAQLRPLLIPARLDEDRKETVIYADLSQVELPANAVHVGPEHDPQAKLSLAVRNVGTGIALITGVGLEPAAGPAQLSESTVPVGEATRIMFTLDREREDWEEFFHALDFTGTFSIVVRYTDLAGRQDTVSRFDVHRSLTTSEWYVRQTFHRYEGVDAEVAAAPRE